MKNFKYMAMLLIVAMLAFTACGDETGDDTSGNINVVFQSAIETGGTSATVESTGLILTFDVDPTTLSADNITVTGARKGALSGTGTTKTLAIGDINVPNEGR